MQLFNDDGYLKWSASQHRLVKSICGWRWVLQKLEDKEGESTMSRAVGSTGHKVNELALQMRHQTGRLPDQDMVDKWADDWFEYHIQKDGKRMLAHEKEYYQSDIECVEAYRELAQMLSWKCVQECTANIDPEVIDGKIQTELPFSFEVKEFGLIVRGFIDVFEKLNIVSDLKFKAPRPLIKESDYGANRVKSIDSDEQAIIYSAAIHTLTGKYPTSRFHFILNKNNKALGPHSIYDPVDAKHADHHMAILANNLRGVRPLIEAAIQNPDIMLPSSEYTTNMFCSEDQCDFWDQCDKHY